MNYFSLALLALTFNAFAAGRQCAVEGISDSPQALHCSFEDRHLQLTCMNGKYLLGHEPVLYTWHEEVEEGNSPLVFKTATVVMKITKQERSVTYDALLEAPAPITGTCEQ